MKLDPETILDTPVAPATVAALVRSPGARRAMERVVARMRRRGQPNPGGAAAALDIDIPDPTRPGERVSIHLPAQRHGGRPLVVHHLAGGASLHGGTNLKVPHLRLPEAVALAAEGRPIGHLIDMADTGIDTMAEARVVAVFDVQGPATLIHTDAPTKRLALKDVAA